MSRIPNFADVAFQPVAASAPAGSAEPWLTPEGILVKPAYGEADLAGLDFLETYPGIAPYLRGPYPTMAPARNPIFPDVPTLKESMGIEYATGAWRGIGAPKNLPPELATKLTAALKKVYDSAEFKDFMRMRCCSAHTPQSCCARHASPASMRAPRAMPAPISAII